MSDFNEPLLVFVELAAICFIGFLIFHWNQRAAQRRHETVTRMLDKMSSEEFVALLKTDAGRMSMERMLGAYRPPQAWVTEAVRRAAILGSVGVGLLVAAAVTGYFTGWELLVVGGAIFVSVALGYLIAAAITRGRTSSSADTTA